MTGDTGIEVRRARAEEMAAVARVLARAFHDDPPAAWMFPDPRRRARQLERSFALFLRAAARHGECWIAEGAQGAAVWTPPRTGGLGRWEELRLLPAGLRAAGRDFPRVQRFLGALTRAHPRRPAHWYLPYVGVDPDAQGRGIGAALLAPVLDRCDAEGVPAYLEASSPRSRPLYERLGFEVRGEVSVDGSPPVWPMWREPA